MDYSYSVEQRIILQAKYFTDDEDKILLAFKSFTNKFMNLNGVSIEAKSMKVRDYKYDIIIATRSLTLRIIALGTVLTSISIEISNNGKLNKFIDINSKKAETIPLTEEEIKKILFKDEFNYENIIELLMESIFK